MLGTDLVTEAMHRHIAARGVDLAIECARTVERRDSAPAHVLNEIQEICSRHEFFSTLILSRKTPLQTQAVLTGVAAHPLDASIRRAWAIETVLVATNAMMRWCVQDFAIETPRQRNFLTPAESHMDDVIRLVVLCGFHRLMALNANAEARRPLTAPGELNALLAVYNTRLARQSRCALAEIGQPSVLGLMLLADLPFDPVMQVTDDRLGASQGVRLWNYCPLPLLADDTLGYAAFLQQPFPADDGLSFHDARKAWLAINTLAWGRVPNWRPGQPYTVQSRRDDILLEVMFDLCETGLDGSTLSDLRDTSYDLLVRAGQADLPAKDMYQRFLDQIIFDTTQLDDFDPDFVELPYAIYKVGPNAILWDHLRSPGLFKAIARRAMRTAGGGGTGAAKGRAFERVVASVFAQRVSPTAPVALNVQILSDGRTVLEIDVAIVWRGVLVLVECKAHQKPLQYYKAMPGAVASRVAGMQATLLERDKLLRRHARGIRAQWGDNSTSGAIWVLCTTEVEYTASPEPSLWLVQGSIPRICTAEELCGFLTGDAWATVQAHPAYFVFE